MERERENNQANVYLQLILFKKILFACFAILTLFSGAAFAQTTFTGVVNNNWNNVGNWSAGVPAGAANVIIPSGKICNMIGGDSYVGSGTITLGGTLSVPVGATLNPSGTLTMNANNATLSAGGTVTLATLTVNTTAITDIVFLTNSAATPIVVKNGGTLSLTQGIFNVGTGNTITMGTNGGTTINSTGGNFATTGANGSDGGTILVDPSNGSGAAFDVNSTSANILQFYHLKFGTTVGSSNNNWSVTNAGSVKINGTITVQDNNWNLGNGNPPIYGANSTLSIDNNNQGFTLPAGSNEAKLWTANSGTIGVTPGYPNNVTITNIGNSSGGYQNGNGWVPGAIALGINGTLTLGNGVSNAQVDFSNLTSFTCGGFILNTNSRFTVPKTTMTVNGSWIDNQVVSGTTKGFFINGTSTINFGGTGTCVSPTIIQAPAGNSETFYNIGVVNGTYTKLNSPVIVTNNIALTSGIIATTATNTLSVTNTSTAAITGGSANTYIDGPLKWNMQATAGTYNFPVGSNAVACANDYLPLTLNKVAGSAAIATTQAFTPGSGGTVDATMSSLSTTEYWSVNTSAALPAGSVVSISRPTAISPLAYVAESKTTSTGTYISLAGTASTFGVSNSNDIGAGSTFFFTFGSPPIVSTLAATSITTTSVTLNGAFNTGSSKTTSFNYGLTTGYGTTVNSIHSPINSSTSTLDSQYVIGLTANTVYHYLATDVTDNGSDVVFVTAPNPPVVGPPNTPTANGFTATWTAPSAMGAAPYTYTVQVSSDPSFATGVTTQTGISSGATSYNFTTLASGTQYYYRVEAVNATASSVWSATSAPVSTLIVPTAACTTGNGSPGTTGTISNAAIAPVIDGNIDPVWSTVPSNNITQKINVANEGSGLQAAPNNTSTWKTIWDVNNLYILVQVTDASLVSQGNLAGATNISTLNGGANLWDVDGIEFYLDGNNNKGGAYDNTNDFQLRFNLGSAIVTGVGNAPFASLAPRISFSMVVTAGGYLLEAAIPWSGAGGVNSGAYPSVTAGNKIGIDFSINDNDGTAWRTAQQGWYDGLSGSVNQYNNTTLFGTATLATCPQPPTVILPTVTNITATGATFGATVTSSGDSPLTARGTGYTASPNTTGTGNAVPEGGTGVSIYSGPPRTGLAPQTQYYYLGYATNTNGGTGVSNVASFYTLSALPTVQPVLSANACTQMILNWTAITFPPVAQATQTGYLVLRAPAPAVPVTTGIATRVATAQSALSAGTTLVTTITSGATHTYTDASAAAGVTYNYLLVPFTWDGVVTDSTYNYFTASPSAVSASISPLVAPGASATQQPTCAVLTGTITISPWDNTLTYSVDGTNFLAGPTFSSLTPATYNVVAKNSSGCVSIATPVTIAPSPATPVTPTAIALQPTCTVATGSVTITPVVGLTYSIDGTSYFAFSNAAFSNLTLGTYQLTAKNSSGCISIPVAIPIIALSTPCPDFFIPNLITPNNDGKNDLFEITALPAGSSLTVVNRWGDNVYQSSNYDNLWTGSNASDGVYYYNLLLPDGKEYKSWLNIIR